MVLNQGADRNLGRPYLRINRTGRVLPLSQR
ncbi:hypothetical protein CLV84_2789 [Neolewinella xylanilytica]|uniref:Uncharacterized protein n=1 Tax=Neolewinella xylanilytica TaxID=1514080 RepID=A0A2S6I3W7_9BACT|nr:hypothetical protein CLV84_2789 [Neolewinella xylanilytica]